MCAIFGFIARRDSSNPKSPAKPTTARFDPAALARIIEANVQRGPHAFGLAWIDGRGRLRMFKQAGLMTDHLPVLRMVEDARLLVGHLRYATHGDPEDNLNNHPHPVDGGWLVHNGVIRNHAQLTRRHELTPVSECDTEVLGLLAERVDEVDGPARRGRLWRMARAAELCEGALATMALWSRPAALVAVRRGNPLHWSPSPEGMYLATLAQGLPGSARSLPDNRAWCFRAGPDGTIRSNVLELEPPAVSWSFSAGRGSYRGG